MTRNTSILRGITNHDLKQVIRKAMDKGWVIGEMTGTTHCHLIWPATGEKVGFGTTVSDRNYYKSFARQCERICGEELLPRVNHSRPKATPNKVTGYTTTRLTDTQLRWSTRIETLTEEYKNLRLEFLVISSHPEAETPNWMINEAFKIVRRMSEIEQFLKELNHPIPQ